MPKDELSDEKMMVKQIGAATSLVDQAYEAIRQAIVEQSIKPGVQLRQIQLAEQLGVSPRTVREALNRLVAEGLAVHEPYKGVRAIDLSADTRVEIYTMRMMLEGWAIELAADSMSDEDIDRMRTLLHETANPDPESAPRVREANREFHWIAIKSTGKPYLIRTLEQLWSLTSTHVLRKHSTDADRAITTKTDLAEHEALLDALARRDGKHARRILEQHISRTLDVHLKRMQGS